MNGDVAGCLWFVLLLQEKNEVFDESVFLFFAFFSFFFVFFVDFSISDLDFLFRAKTFWAIPFGLANRASQEVTCELDGQATLKRLQ
jgi:hypothetical protein